ncbi:ATP-binding protein [Neptunicoccus sediminis]|uniref:sensor histidine kinase n=1 Tax=Neptunicoccus sediminis TaxID=1892596 RepID=UPI000845DE1D|nr:ATP-binding protein [Neptunicoccus sediminis]
MLTVLHSMHSEHDFALVLLAALLCTFGSWVVSSLYRHAMIRPKAQAVIWYFVAAATAGIAIWCTHFIAILAYQPNAPVHFNLQLTFASLLIAIFGCTIGILISGMFKTNVATAIGGIIFGLSVSAMHYTGMVAYRVDGIVTWDKTYLVASVILSVILATLALFFGRNQSKRSTLWMTFALSLGIIALHFTGMAAFKVTAVELALDYANPDEYKLIAFVIAGTATLIVLGGLFTYFIENRTRMESIEELRKARDEAESASRAKSEFMSVLSHELRTPLTIIIGYAGFLSVLKDKTTARLKPDEPITEQHFHSVGDQAQQYGERVKVAGKHLLTIINEILDYTSIELNDIKLAKTAFDPRELLDEVEDEFKGLAGEKQAVLETECDEMTVMADRSRCQQILINLIGNALKFSQASKISVRAKREGTGFLFEVEDNGCGIPKKDLDLIFQAFTQLESSDNRKEGGTGLGLSISKKLSTAHGGDIRVESTLGSGTKFSVTIPDSLVKEDANKSSVTADGAGKQIAAAA